MPNVPVPSARIETGSSGCFTEFERRVPSVPHPEIKAKLDAGREAKRAFKASSSLISGASPSLR
jgi:hypothetical protein